MMPRYPTYGKAASTPQQPLGSWRGKIVAVNHDGTLDVAIPRIAGLDGVFRSLEALGFEQSMPYAVGDAVYVTFVEGRVDDLVVLGPVRRGHPVVPRWCGSFFDTSTQVNTGTTSANTISCNSTAYSNGIYIIDATKITFDHAGHYNIQFSAQFDKTDSGDDDFEVWISQNGSDLPWTSTIVTLHGNNARDVAAWNFLVFVEDGDYVQLKWHSADSTVRILARAAQTSPTRPAIPSVILTVVPV